MTTKRILVTGGAGVAGSRLVKGLCSAGHCVTVLTLPGDTGVTRLSGCSARIVYADVSDAKSVFGACTDIDVVYHLAAVILAPHPELYRTVNVQGTAHMVAEARRGGVGHFIFVSSASVVYPDPTDYSLSKIEAEGIVRESGLPFTIARPTLIYERNGGEEFVLFLNYLKRFPIVPFIGNGRSLKRPVHVDDILQGLAAIAEHDVAKGKIYNLSGAESISLVDFARLCMKVTLTQRPIVHLPVWFCKICAGFLSLVSKNPPLTWQGIAGFIQDADLDPKLAQEDLGYTPTRVSQKLPMCFIDT